MDTNLAPDEGTRPPEAAPLRLLFVSDMLFVRQALERVLERDPAVADVRCADPAETMALSLTAQADAVLVDTALGEGPAVVRRLREIAPNTAIIACALRETAEDVIAWAEAGVTGYLPNTVGLEQIVQVVRDILAGQQFCSSRVAAGLLRRIAAAAGHSGGETPAAVRALTRRERQIAELIAAGLADKEIARRLNISLATTKSHVHNLLGKLSVEHRGHVAEVLRGRVQHLLAS
ncbi:MAG TPA: response regulator transcription factor [Stellaceae bacterium]|nr:response regulator transcription factor [Stellaceae bacterium]